MRFFALQKYMKFKFIQIEVNFILKSYQETNRRNFERSDGKIIFKMKNGKYFQVGRKRKKLKLKKVVKIYFTLTEISHLTNNFIKFFILSNCANKSPSINFPFQFLEKFFLRTIQIFKHLKGQRM